MRILQARSLLAVGLLGSLTIVLATVPALAQGVPGIDPNKCLAKKNKCINKKIAGLLKCRSKCQQKPDKCGQPQTDCEQKVLDKFDGGTTPAKGCFAKLEAKQDFAKPESICTTTGDAATMGADIDAAVGDLLATLEGNPPPVCGDGIANGDESCDGADLAGASCPSLGYASGTLGCTAGCGYDLTACVPNPTPSCAALGLTDQTVYRGTGCPSPSTAACQEYQTGPGVCIVDGARLIWQFDCGCSGDTAIGSCCK